MSAMDLLLSRASTSKLGDPAPDDEALDRILRAALRAPDHGALRPWRLLIVRGDARAKLGEIFAESVRRSQPDKDEADLARERGKPLRAPIVVVVAASLTESRKAPEIEQLLSAGCVAHGIVLAAQAEGFGAIWKTGSCAYDRFVHERLGLDDAHRIVAFVYLGTPLGPPAEVVRPAIAQHAIHWS